MAEPTEAMLLIETSDASTNLQKASPLEDY
jgi:hypothetical protein